MMKNEWLSAEKLLIIGHRGASADAPENTLLALQLAKTHGADGIEFDVWLSADDIPVLLHDQHLQRTTNGTGRVGDYTAEQLAQFDAGQGQPIPTLAQLFATVTPPFLYNVEIKEGGARAEQAVTAVLAVIAHYGVGRLVTISSFEPETVKAALRLAPPEIAVGFLHEPTHPLIPTWFCGHALHPHWSQLSADYMTSATQKALRVHTWTVDDAQLARSLQQQGVSAIITNRPNYLRTLLFP